MALRLRAGPTALALVTATAVTAITAVAACVVSPTSRPADAATAPRYSRPGPYAAGVTTLDLPDRKVEVWYPAKPKATAGASPATFDLVERVPPAIVALLPQGASLVVETDAFRGVPAASRRGGFPLVLMAHDTAGYREQLQYLATHLASWGFVVASPDLLERGLAAMLGSPPAAPIDDLTVMRDTEALLRGASNRAGGPLQGRVLADRVAITGQSAGGATALRFGVEPGVVTVIPLSAGSVDTRSGDPVPLPEVPTMFVTGAADSVVPLATVQAGFETARAPTRLVVIDGAGHASVAGICPIGGPGGLVGLAERNRLAVPDAIEQLVSDGCANPAPDPDPTWAPIDQAVTAQLREAFGLDRRPQGLDQRTFDKFAPTVVRYRERL